MIAPIIRSGKREFGIRKSPQPPFQGGERTGSSGSPLKRGLGGFKDNISLFWPENSQNTIRYIELTLLLSIVSHFWRVKTGNQGSMRVYTV